MNIAHWIATFERNRDLTSWEEPNWDEGPPPLNDEVRKLLAESLATFQLGESGGGTRLRRFVAEQTNRGNESGNSYLTAIDLFIAEEQRHAALLADAVRYLGGDLKTKHWINSIFRKVRSLVNMEFNIQVLLIAELIAEAYYGLIYQHITDPSIRSLCGKILRDEVQHIAFHRDFFREIHATRLPVASALWDLQFQVLFAATEIVVWADHGKCLRALGITRSEYTKKARGCCRRFLYAIDSRRAALPEASPETPDFGSRGTGSLS